MARMRAWALTVSQNMPVPKRVAIVGGGIAGLSTAFALVERAGAMGKPLHCTVLEGQPAFGGKIVTNHVQGLVVEGGPDSFLTTKPSALALCDRLGLTSQLLNTSQGNGRALTFSRGRLREFPQGLIAMVPTQPGSLFRSGVVSWSGIVRMGAEWWIPVRPETDGEETLAGFFIRRLGAEAFHRLIEPFVAGIYAGDANELSADATFPQFIEWERTHGSLLKGALAMRRARSAHGQGATSARTLFASLRGGLGDVITRLSDRLSDAGVSLRCGTTVLAVHSPRQTHPDQPYRLELEGGATVEAEAVVLATPAYMSAGLMQSIDRESATLLDQIPYASTITISMAYAEREIGHRLRGYGFVVPRIENRGLIAATWSSMKWAGRAPSGQCLIRCYLGGRGREDLLELDDADLTNHACRELDAMAGIQSRPFHVEVYRWPRAMPQYVCGHRARVRRIRQGVARYPGLYLTGAAYDGIGIPDCIRDAGNTAQSLSDFLWPAP